MTIEGVITACCPQVSVIQIIVNHLAGGIKDQFDVRQAGVSLWKALQGFLNKGVTVPAQFSDVLRMAAKGQTKLNLEIVGSEEPLQKIDRMVNKLALCIITAGLTVGSSLLCSIELEQSGAEFPGPPGWATCFPCCSSASFCGTCTGESGSKVSWPAGVPPPFAAVPVRLTAPRPRGGRLLSRQAVGMVSIQGPTPP